MPMKPLSTNSERGCLEVSGNLFFNQLIDLLLQAFTLDQQAEK